MMDDFQSETDSDYTSYWRDWVCENTTLHLLMYQRPPVALIYLYESTLQQGRSICSTRHRDLYVPQILSYVSMLPVRFLAAYISQPANTRPVHLLPW